MWSYTGANETMMLFSIPEWCYNVEIMGSDCLTLQI